MKILFYIVHPSKYHLIKYLVQMLQNDGNYVRVLYCKKDVMQDLIKSENWNSKNIMPEGRLNKRLPFLLAKFYLLIKSIFRLRKEAKREYDLFFTDDSLVFLGKLIGVKSVFFTDDHLKAIPYLSIFYLFADYILAPKGIDLGYFNKKTIFFNGYKQSAYLHKKYQESIIKNKNIIDKYNLTKFEYIIIRAVGLDALHDKGKIGIDHSIYDYIIDKYPQYRLIIIPEKIEKIPKDFRKYIINICPKDIFEVMYYSRLLIADSQSMSAEAAFLGTPFIWCSHFYNKIYQLEELSNTYKLGYAIPLDDHIKFQEILDYELSLNEKKKDTTKLMYEKVDLTVFIFNFIQSLISEK